MCVYVYVGGKKSRVEITACNKFALESNIQAKPQNINNNI